VDSHAGCKSGGQCAKAIRKGLEAGGLDTKGRPTDAKDYGPFLVKHGAENVPDKNYTAQKGDIAVFEGNKQHPHGHIEVYDGKQWVSDFKQKNYSPYRTNVPDSEIYRFGD
jgi:hypothetical protein